MVEQSDPAVATTELTAQQKLDKDTLALIDRVLDKVEDFYYEEGENSGQALFAGFASQHHEQFVEDCNAQEQENKPE